MLLLLHNAYPTNRDLNSFTDLSIVAEKIFAKEELEELG